MISYSPKKGTFMNENFIAKQVLDACFDIHRNMGPRLLESIYENMRAFELKQAGLSYKRQVPVPVKYKGVDFGIGFRADLIVEDCVVVELKSVELILPVHKKQVLSYLRLLDLRLALLVNFNGPLLHEGITRIVNKLDKSLDIERANSSRSGS